MTPKCSKIFKFSSVQIPNSLTLKIFLLFSNLKTFHIPQYIGFLNFECFFIFPKNLLNFQIKFIYETLFPSSLFKLHISPHSHPFYINPHSITFSSHIQTLSSFSSLFSQEKLSFPSYSFTFRSFFFFLFQIRN